MRRHRHRELPRRGGGVDTIRLSFDRHRPASFGIGVGQVIKGRDQTVPGADRFASGGSIPPNTAGSAASRRPASAAKDTLVFVIDIISTR